LNTELLKFLTGARIQLNRRSKQGFCHCVFFLFGFLVPYTRTAHMMIGSPSIRAAAGTDVNVRNDTYHAAVLHISMITGLD